MLVALAVLGGWLATEGAVGAVLAGGATLLALTGRRLAIAVRLLPPPDEPWVVASRRRTIVDPESAQP